MLRDVRMELARHAWVQDAMLTAARLEGLLLDPVYTSKAFAHFLGLIREKTLSDQSAAIFLHTGGTPALFAYGGLATGLGGETGAA